MPQRRLVDTNLVVRHLVQDDRRQAKVAGRLFQACDRAELVLVVLPAVLAECVFVLESFYRHARADIARVIAELVSSPGVELGELEIHLDALGRYATSKMHFVDCLIAATAAARDIGVATFDRGFKRFPDVRVETE